MPRPRVTAGPASQVVHVGPQDAFPPALTAHILSLPTTNTACGCNESELEFSEPSAKRRKLASTSPSSICIARADVTASRLCEDSFDGNFSSHHQDVRKSLSLGLEDGKLRICVPSASSRGSSAFLISINACDAGQHAGEILGLPEQSVKRNGPGSIWSSAALLLEKHGNMVSLKISLQAFWIETTSPLNSFRTSRERQLSEKVIQTFFPEVSSTDLEPWSPMDFYEAAHVPSKDDKDANAIDIPRLEAKLFPYQKRSLQWLLRREGVTWVADLPGLAPLRNDQGPPSLETFRVVRDADGRDVYLSDVFQVMTSDPAAFHQVGTALRGGILSEEMGLGKTLEIISLILVHQRPAASVENLPLGQGHLTRSGATLIVTPSSLRPQWLSELSRHAPGLRVKDYTGRRVLKEEDEVALRDDLAKYDVVVTTYNVLSADLPFALSPPERSRRHERVYQRKTSPLVQISWWRVCLDEAQMIESGVSQAAALAKLIPRMNSWGITGTPVKDDVKDLRGLLSFLCFEPFSSVSEIWSALTTRHKQLFKQLCNTISLRHTKALVRDEISLPPQKRYVISMPFTAVEEQHYQSMFKEMTQACDVDVGGAPAVLNWDPNDYEDVMRLWLNRLRQTTLHPEIGVYGRRVLGNSKDRPMRTVEEVLNAMLEQSELAIRTDERAYLAGRLFLGQMYENGPQVSKALTIWEAVRKETDKLVAEARFKFHQAFSENGGKIRAQNQLELDDLDEEGSSADSDDEVEVDERSKSRHGEARNRLREALELHHRAVFFCANAYFQMRERRDAQDEPGPSSEIEELKKLEEKGYEDAKLIRREILHESHRKASRLMEKVGLKAVEQSFMEIPELEIKEKGGLETHRVVSALEALYADLNAQANVIDELREISIQLLLKPLVDAEEDVETTGEELADSTAVQEELIVHVQALQAIIADRQEAMSGQANLLKNHEINMATRLAKNGAGPAPLKFLELLALKDHVKPTRSNLSMRGVIGELRSLKSKLGVAEHSQRDTLESKIVKDLLNKALAVLTEQSKAVVKLEAELESFTRVMNSRVGYYRQLQAVSDAVLPYEGIRSEAVVTRAEKTIEDVHKRLLSAQAKQRYLLNLKESGTKSNEPRMCVICQMPFVTGVLTICGHQFCKECMMLWFKAHRNCPVCKKTLKADNLHDITIKPRELQVRSERTGQLNNDHALHRTHSLHHKSTTIYSEFNADKLEEMKNIELDGPSFTTKVDTLVRHLLWLRQSDPGAKSIVFSQYKDFLGVLQNAFRRFRIGYASVDEPMGITKFKEDTGIECFLLHARAHSSGLNLVNASHVFLCEPLLNTAIELQAIARVDRIGQQHETTVWLYIVSGTVEESIYNLSVRRRMEHMGRHIKDKSKESTPELLDANIEAANTLEMEHAALSKLMSRDHSAGEMVHHNDLWECLFGHVAGEASSAAAQAQPATSLQERAVMSYLAGEAAGRRNTTTSAE